MDHKEVSHSPGFPLLKHYTLKIRYYLKNNFRFLFSWGLYKHHFLSMTTNKYISYLGNINLIGLNGEIKMFIFAIIYGSHLEH